MAIVLAVAFAVFYAAAVTVIHGTRSVPDSPPSRPVSASPDGGVLTNRNDQLSVSIRNHQDALRVHPDDASRWAELGAAYVQQGRITANPAYYPKAAGALRRSLALESRDNFEAMIGMGTLENALHNFTSARSWGRRAERLNRYNANVYAILNDALTQLGDYPGASTATQHMLQLHPGVPSFTRVSYDFEQHGDDAGAKLALDKALGIATSPADIAFCRYYLGELAFNVGKTGEAAKQYAAGLKADPTYTPLLAGKAKVEAALGQTADAVRDYTTVIGRVPQPQYVVELAELEQSLGHAAEARQQYELLGAEFKLFAANGVNDDLTSALFEADHGSPAKALRYARSEWSRRHSVLVADALAWALHVNHRDVEALQYAKIANHLGWHNALFRYHKGMIEESLGQKANARKDLAEALKFNPVFNPIQAPIARRTLSRLEHGP